MVTMGVLALYVEPMPPQGAGLPTVWKEFIADEQKLPSKFLSGDVPEAARGLLRRV